MEPSLSSPATEHHTGPHDVFVVEIGADQCITLVNPEFCRLTGMPEHELVGLNWFETFVPFEWRQNEQLKFIQLVSGKRCNVQYEENEILLPSGKRLAMGWHHKVVKNEHDSIVGLLSSGEDLNRKYHVELSLQEERQKAQIYLDIVDVLVMVTDAAQQILQINRKGCALLESMEKAIVGANLDQFLPQPVLEQLRAGFQNASAQENKTSLSLESELFTASGNSRIIAWHHQFLKNSRGEVTATLSSGIDISQQRRAEKLLRIQRDLALLLTSAFPQDTFFEKFIKKLFEIPGIHQVGLYDYNPQHQKLVLQTFQPALWAPTSVPFNDAIHKDYLVQLEKGTPVFLNEKNTAFPSSLTVFRSVTIIPLNHGGRFLGAINLASSHYDKLEEDILNVLYTLCAQLSTIMVQLEDRQVYRTTEALNHNILENVGMGMILLDTQFKVMAVNSQIRRWFTDVTVHRDLRGHQLIAQTDHLHAQCPVQQSLDDGQRHEAIIPFGSDCQHQRFFRMITSPVLGEDNRVIMGIIVLIEDVTQKIKTEEAVHNMHLRTAQILASIPSILIGLNAHDRIFEWNTAAEKAFGLTQAQTMYQPFSALPLTWSLPPEVKRFRATLTGQQELHCPRVPYQRADGKEGILDLRISRMAGTENQADEFLIVGLDITKNRLLEAQLLQAQKLESIGQLSAGIAHEINTPIQYVGDNIRFLDETFLEFQNLINEFLNCYSAFEKNQLEGTMLERLNTFIREIDLDFLMEEIPSAVKQALEGVERVATIVRALKGFAHPDRPGEIKTIDINQAIQNTITVARNEWKYVAEMETQLAQDLPLVACYPGEFNQVILNLIVNAAHAIGEKLSDNSEQKGKITIITSSTAEEACIVVSDTGTGIPKTIQDKIFDPFFTTKEVGKGTGQGLALARTVITEKHHGRLGFKSVPGEGTTFTIYLPINGQENPND